MKSGFLAITFLFVACCLAACESNTNTKSDTSTYSGSLIEVDFNNKKRISDQDWIIIDGIKFTHFSDLKKSQKDEFSLPASRVTLSEGDEEFNSVTNKYTIAIMLGNYLDMINSREENIGGVRVQRRDLLLSSGIMRLQKPDSSKFVVETSKNYSADIKVIEK